MDKIFLFLSLLGLSSCMSSYHEVLSVEKYPMEWSDTIIYQEDHWHFQSSTDEWTCVELDPDTIYLDVKDTLYIEKLDLVYYNKNKKR